MPPTPTPLSRHTKTASLSFFHLFLTHTTGRPPREPRTIALAQSAPRRPREWTADQRGDREGLQPPPHPVSTRFHVLCARGKPRIPLVGVALGAGARRAAVPPPSRRRRRGRGCAAAAARHFRRARAHTRDASVRETARGAPDRGPPPHRTAGRPLRARRRCQVGRWGADAAAAAAVGAAATGRPHVRTRAASTGCTCPRGQGPPAARGRVGVPQPRPGGTPSEGGGEASGAAAVGGPTAPHRGRPWRRPPAGLRHGSRARPRQSRATTAVARDRRRLGGGAETQPWLRPPPSWARPWTPRRRRWRKWRRGAAARAPPARRGGAPPPAPNRPGGRRVTGGGDCRAAAAAAPAPRHHGGYDRRGRRRHRGRHRCGRGRGRRPPPRAGARRARGRRPPTARSAAGAAATPPAAVAAPPTRRARVSRAWHAAHGRAKERKFGHAAWHAAHGRSVHGQGSHRLTTCKDAALPRSKIQKHAPQRAQSHLRRKYG